METRKSLRSLSLKICECRRSCQPLHMLVCCILLGESHLIKPTAIKKAMKINTLKANDACVRRVLPEIGVFFCQGDACCALKPTTHGSGSKSA